MSKEQTSREFEQVVVMVCYGQRRTYKVNRIAWEHSPRSYSFKHGELNKEIGMLDYLKSAYNARIIYPDQPLFEIKQRRQNIYIPPELCILVGLPPSIRNDKRAMLDIRKKIFQEPRDRIQSMQQLSEKINQHKDMQDWNLQLQTTPDEIDTTVLDKPVINSAVLSHSSYAEQAILAKIVEEPVDLDKWAVFCLERDVEAAQYIQQ